MEQLNEAGQVVDFWRSAGPQRWFTKDPAFDREFSDKCLRLHERALAGELDAWGDTAPGALALVLLLDQLPRNAFRDTARMFASDEQALRQAERAIEAGFDRAVDPALRFFFYLPFEHSERIEDQERSVALHEAIGFTQWAYEHRDIIRRFGRFPHRNQVLGRATTAEERAFLEAGGFRG